MGRPRRRGKRFPPYLLSLASLLVLAAGLLSAEIWARRRTPPPDGSIPDYLLFLRDAGRPRFLERRNANETKIVTASGHRYFARAEFFKRKPTDATRVLVLGESNAIDLAEALRVSAGGNGVPAEVLNAAVSAASLDMVERTFDEAVRIGPDVLVVCFGHNLTYLHPPLSGWRYHLLRLLYRSRLAVRLLHPGRKNPNRLPAGPQLERWAAFLRRAGTACREAGVKLVVYTLAGNLRLPPSGEEAEKLFAEAVRLEQRGRAREAYELYARAKDADLYNSRSKEALNRLTREIAREQGFLLADSEALVRRQAPRGIPGWETFYDFCHLRPEKRHLLVDPLLPILRRERTGRRP